MRYVLNLSLALIDLASHSVLASLPFLSLSLARARTLCLLTHSYLIASFMLASRVGGYLRVSLPRVV